LLAAGLGTRLRPLTLTTPKCLIEINGEPLLINWLNKLEKIGCDEVLINTHYLPLQVENAIKKWGHHNLKITITFEEKLLGTAGTLRRNLNFFNDANVLLIHADNYTNLDLMDFLNSFHSKNKHCLLSMVTFLTDKPEKCGVVKTNNYGVLEEYYEKVSDPPSNIANGAIFAFDEDFIKVFSLFPPIYSDFCAEIIPNLKGKVQTYFTNCFFVDIGTPSSLKLAKDFCK
tara:strand:- start:510 stop:1196 length:687 start_codon:yes stop_codon:yes gene_type:complete